MAATLDCCCSMHGVDGGGVTVVGLGGAVKSEADCHERKLF